MRKLEVGQYWHNLKNNKELLVSAEIAESVVCRYACEVTKYETMQTEVGEKYYLKYDDVINLGYVLGRHPDNIEQWQPKEGDLVWVKGRKNQGNIFHSPTKGKIVEFEGSLYAAWKSSKHSTTLTNEPLLFLEIEPYADQDKKIDFSKAGQWLYNKRKGIVKTTGMCDELKFTGIDLLSGKYRYSYPDYNNGHWKLLTPEQVQPLLDAIKGLTESQSD